MGITFIANRDLQGLQVPIISVIRWMVMAILACIAVQLLLTQVT